MSQQKVETASAFLWLREDGIIETQVKKGHFQTLANAKENIEAASKLASGKKIPILNDYADIGGMEKACRDFYAGAEVAAAHSACAIMVNNFLSQAIGNFFLGLNRPQTPTRLFKSKEKALVWLKEYL